MDCAGDGWYVAGGKGGVRDKTIINQMMLRFRPIAPKPAAEGSSSSGQKSAEAFGGKRVKRKYIRVRKNNCTNNRSAAENQPEAAVDSASVTLQLMPEKTGSKDFTGSGSWCGGFDRTAAEVSDNRGIPSWMKLNHTMNKSVGSRDSTEETDLTAAVPPVGAVESWVTVESVTDTCMDVRGIECTDVQKMDSLEKDTCPGFISDGSNRVRWVSDAYKRMVLNCAAPESVCVGQPEVVVWLVTKAELPDFYPAFSCRVRLQYYTWQQKERCSKTVPCDVWRMERGGLAWRLDIKAALSLGL